jgi:hypothetical protein
MDFKSFAPMVRRKVWKIMGGEGALNGQLMAELRANSSVHGVPRRSLAFSDVEVLTFLPLSQKFRVLSSRARLSGSPGTGRRGLR